MLEEQALLRGREVGPAERQSLHGWFPVSLQHDPATVWWRFMGEQRFTAPFFDDTLAWQAAPDRRVCSTPLSALEDLPDSVPPAAFIFHVSRCGSTLLTQALATSPQCIVMSEPPALNAFFRLHHRHPEHSGGARTLQRLVAALGQRRSPAERHLVIKFDCWHLPWIPFVQAAFPGTPVVFLYREPSEVLASHRRQRGRQMVPGLIDLSRLADMLHRPGAPELAPGDLDGHAIRVLESLYRCGLEAATTSDLVLMDYGQLPAVIWHGLLDTLGMECSPTELAALQARSGFHSKHSHDRFEGDPLPTHAQPLPPTPEHLGETHRLYQRLEQLRRARSPD
ncbi:hypothetical protein PMI14_02742 [Acidovorax sp. CF316]|uniref:sulfotransferase family protein n=1 Tax=Acidovorax sp. CF316 TaxID=1144317 RepID=UPI00026BD76F|nr:sulfotransferase family protein [Acidovorax sp. CF316]EJE52531.1 hypothetical protein PMI14_02742 [Acidovorax sp. CF316]